MDRDWTASPIFGRRRQSRHKRFSSRRGATEVKLENEMDIDDKRQGDGGYSASADTATDDTASADTDTD